MTEEQRRVGAANPAPAPEQPYQQIVTDERGREMIEFTGRRGAKACWAELGARQLQPLAEGGGRMTWQLFAMQHGGIDGFCYRIPRRAAR